MLSGQHHQPGDWPRGEVLIPDGLVKNPAVKGETGSEAAISEQLTAGEIWPVIILQGGSPRGGTCLLECLRILRILRI